MKILMRLTAAALVLGALGASACSSCSQSSTDTGSTSSAVMQPQSYRCGPGTVLQGNQCVATTSTSGTTRPSTVRN